VITQINQNLDDDDDDDQDLHIDPLRDENVELSRIEATSRANAVSGCKYDLVISFLNNDKTYEGYVRVTFK
jgi:hypothetical protein